MDEREVMVTIRTITYNHEPFIRQCLDSFLMQKTNFRFIIVIHDDASTDRTADIIREYQQKYPEVIKPILQTENQYSKGYNLICELLDNTITSKYQALCEGDDYWTDPMKLQKQYDFMEAHPEYSACFHQAIIHYEDGSQPDQLYSDIEDRDYTGIELFNQNHRPPTASLFMRTSVCKSQIYQKILSASPSFFDIPTILSCAHEGKIRGMSDIMSVYRKQQGGMTYSFRSATKGMLKIADDTHDFYKIFGKEYKKDCIDIYIVDYVNYFLANLHYGKYKIWSILKVLLRYPFSTIRIIRERWIAHHYFKMEQQRNNKVR